MSKRIPIFIGCILVCIAVWLLITPTKFVRLVVERLDHIGYDIQLRSWILTQADEPLGPVAIIDIDDRSLKVEGRWPWQRSHLANLVSALETQGAAVIVFDILFSENEKNIAERLLETLQTTNLLTATVKATLQKSIPLFNEDATFSKALANYNTVLALGFLPKSQTQNILPPPLIQLAKTENAQLAIIDAAGYISNIPILQAAAKVGGFINIYADNDGIIRHAPLIINYKNGIYPSLALQAVLSFLGEHISLVTPHYGNTIKLEGVKHGSKVIPTDEAGQVLIPFIGKSYTFPYYSATDVLHGNIPKDALAGKILFVGTSATGLGDLNATAVQNPFPGVEIQATIANGILQDNFSESPEWTYGATIVLTVLFGLIATFIFPYLGPRLLALIVITLPIGLLFLNNWIWRETGLILSFLVPVLLTLTIAVFNIIFGYLFETRKREHLKEMFGQYVPEKHIDEMLKTKGSYALHGEDREMTVLFADIRNFTTISENMSASDLVEMLNTFFTPMTEIIFTHRGTIDKYVGDLIMAFWGAPLKDKHHPRHAIESALEMQTKVKLLHPTLSEKKWPALQIGIGINSGVMSVGDMGSIYRRNYTVLGDQVNLASRIEGLTKYYGVDILVTESTQHDQSKFIFRKLDKVRVKGKFAGIAIYEVICKLTDATPELKNDLATYHAALDFYFEQKWDTAYDLFSALAKEHPEVKLYKIYLERIEEFKRNPPFADWDGVYVHTAK